MITSDIKWNVSIINKLFFYEIVQKCLFTHLGNHEISLYVKVKVMRTKTSSVKCLEI